MRPIDLTVIGDINQDLLLQIPRFPVLDDEVEVSFYKRYPGGDAANVASAAAKLGVKSALLASVGNDEEGNWLVQSFTTLGINTDLITRQSEIQTGLVIGLIRPDGQRNLLTHRGANEFRGIAASQLKALTASTAVHISDPLPDEVEVLADLLQKLKPALVSLDPGAITAQRGLKDLLCLLEQVKVCFLNEGELFRLTGREQLQYSLKVIFDCGPEIVVIKKGALGCLVAKTEESISIPAFPIKVIDTTGAGDAFDAGFLYGLLHNLPLLEAGRFANAVGGLTTRALGAQSSQPSLQEVESFLKGELS